MYLPTGTELSQVYDAPPNLFQEGLIKRNLAFAVDGQFDHRRMSVERLLAEVKSWRVLPNRRAGTVVTEMLTALDEAVATITPPKGVSAGMAEQVQWNVRRLLAGSEISRRKRWSSAHAPTCSNYLKGSAPASNRRHRPRTKTNSVLILG
ncbi:MAG: hypothetical protein EPN48_14415 [Microbacteriaceae bacterium]|nr:MAG: hypothetical protein EPN48_14415 [Microbacteriaceae bacterium]